jgi:microcystin degradation protein MlrC
MARRLFAGGIGTETNVFSPIPTGIDDYTVVTGEAPAELRDTVTFGTSFRAYAEIASRHGYDLVLGSYAYALPAGLTTRSAYTTLRDQLLDALGAALPLAGVVLTLHGAMAAEGTADCETDLLEGIRARIGERVPIGALLDCHCDLPDRLLELADVLITFKEYPHTDTDERAREVAELVIACAEGRVRPAMASFDCRMVGAYPTTKEPMRGFVVSRLSGSEQLDGVLSVSLAHGFPFSDVPRLGANMLVVTDGDAGRAAELAEELGREFSALRELVTLAPLSLAAGLDHALELPQEGKPVVVADLSDNPGGGAPGDSTFVLRELLRRGVTNAGLAPIWDPIVVQLAFSGGLDASLRVRLGGKMGPSSGDPLDVTVRVKGLVRDLVQRWPQADGYADVPCGDSALLDCDGIEVTVISNRHQAFGTELFTAFGVDPGAYRLIVVKSINHFTAAYAPLAAEIVYTSPPGALTFDPREVSYERALTASRYPWVADPWSSEPR